jgi:hypothetical protein
VEIHFFLAERQLPELTPDVAQRLKSIIHCFRPKNNIFGLEVTNPNLPTNDMSFPMK